MSVQSWREEFFRVPVVAGGYGNMSWEEALEISIVKWEGLSVENTEKHGCMVKDGCGVINDVSVPDGALLKTEFSVSSNCILCKKANIIDTDIDGDPTGWHCDYCPITISSGSACDEGRHGVSPWGQFIDYNENEPMLEVLKKALDDLKNDRITLVDVT